MVDKPGRRRKHGTSWGKIAAVVIGVIVVIAAGWYIYATYLVAKPAPEYAEIETSFGPIYVELFPACAPKTVANFIQLANSGFYDNLVWHRIDPGFVIQTGDPNTRNGVNSTRSTWGEGGSNKTVPLEVGACSWIGNYAGYLGMAREGNNTYGLNSGTSQFFINLDNSSSNIGLDGHYTAFGKVISGWSYVCRITRIPIYNSTAVSNTQYYDQPKVLTNAFVLNITSIPASAAPTPVPITKGCPG